MKKKAAFTLIELLVVISIISLLLAILMPALSELKRRANSLICQTRLSNLNKLAVVYTNQYDNKFWIGAGWTPNTLYGPADQWMGAVGKLMADTRDPNRDYIKNNKTRCCPAATKPVGSIPQSMVAATAQEHPYTPFRAWGPFPPAGAPYRNRWEEVDIWGSYGDNSWIHSVPLRATSFQGMSVNPALPPVTNPPTRGYYTGLLWQTNLVKHSDIIPVFLDSSWFENYCDNYNDPPISETMDMSNNGPINTQMKTACLNRHNQAINIAFMDGSVRSTALKQLWYQKWNRLSALDGKDAPSYKGINSGLWMARFKNE